MNVLMVCLGNICRSPMAEGILRKKAADSNIDLFVDSAGTGAWHVGEHPDERAIQTAKKFGVDISKLVAREFSTDDFFRFDRIFVMDKFNYENVIRLAPSPEVIGKVELLLNQSNPGNHDEVPDPWFGDNEGFIPVYRMMENACDVFVKSLLVQKKS